MGSLESPKGVLCAGCAGFFCLFGVISLITLLCSIARLGPEDQVLVYYLNGREVYNGAQTKVLNPFREKVWRKATRVDPLEYAVLFNEHTSLTRHVEGPQQVFPGAYDRIVSSERLIVLRRDEYIKFLDTLTGEERVVIGPQNVVPRPYETSEQGLQRAVFLDQNTAVLVISRSTGEKRLETDQGLWFPGPYDTIIATRNKIRVAPHEAVVVRDETGHFLVHQGAGADGSGSGLAFWLHEFENIVIMEWSDYSRSLAMGELPPKVSRTHIDMRRLQISYIYEARTNDNVRLSLRGNIFWQVSDVQRMVASTPDPEGDVWYHMRSAVIQAVSQVPFEEFMENFNTILRAAFVQQGQDSFYSDRGVEVLQAVLTEYQPTDIETRQVLEEIIEAGVNRENELRRMDSDNEVALSRMMADIDMANQTNTLLQAARANEELQAVMVGEAEGTRLARDAASFLTELDSTMPDVEQRLDLYRMHKDLANNNAISQQLAAGQATLFLTTDQMNLNLQIGNVQEL